MPQCASCSKRGLPYRCKKCIVYLMSLIPKPVSSKNSLKLKKEKKKKKNISEIDTPTAETPPKDHNINDNEILKQNFEISDYLNNVGEDYIYYQK